MERRALFSACGRYRSTLLRTWADGGRVAFVMLNPSVADAEHDDPTIRRCIGFAKRWGYGGLEAVNLFAWRAVHPSDMKRAEEPVGPDGDAPLVRALSRCALVVAAWGVHGAHRGRGSEVASVLRAHGSLHHLGLTKEGHPRHPLYLRRDVEPQEWRA